MLMAKEGSQHPFDINTLSGLRWKTSGSLDERRRLFREHWDAIRNRPPLVPMDPLNLVTASAKSKVNCPAAKRRLHLGRLAAPCVATAALLRQWVIHTYSMVA